ncbi:hypothetical protein PHYBLDRAFT_160592 [Phycomyces blakesleeanus NRRL 1555(-)]|uniref:Globin domain-containing protein n=1 Tax=Phycomyces blakesleeanus (strain ATCC 8743b / DSM 1359 / FGSC 10004 / NBRC 33097 / NRRL 1555) TaxID=763407 RepID=A0A162T6G0_PHYB8|nr:hypothetical protein PHYBLDRAFT_160592 [Phycomyces blakesleeanus NRRL 1555(-)]OAD66552.1 hypothetical protein PHYBLDRAFT_160592 [Phycomyces blakesleeanus NRRL 1555(-)]|eukprot:XP_018284592.1 hypothetical protein PHYBLDRAFT_160592 [Phycomyces blakesleeanus NRRL 1555(-)]
MANRTVPPDIETCPHAISSQHPHSSSHSSLHSNPHHHKERAFDIRRLFGRATKDSTELSKTSSVSSLPTERSFSLHSNSLLVLDDIPPSQSNIDIVRYSWERVSEIRLPTDHPAVSPSHAFGLAFYEALFELNGDLKPLFANVFQQARALTGMISYLAWAPTVTGACPPPPTCPMTGKVANPDRVYTIREINARKRAREASLTSSRQPSLDGATLVDAGEEDETTPRSTTNPTTTPPASASVLADEDEDDDPEGLIQQMHELGARHFFYKVNPQYFTLVGPAFVSALKVRLGDEYRHEIGEAWIRTNSYAAYHMSAGLESQLAWEQGHRKQVGNKPTRQKSGCSIQ